MKITKTVSGKWTTVVALKGIDGKQHCKRFTHKDKNVVRSMATDYLAEHRVFIESCVFSDCMARFIERKEKVLSPSTMRGYKSHQRELLKHYDGLCRRSIDRITAADLQVLVDDMTAAGLTPKTIRNRIGFISSIFHTEDQRMPRVDLPAVVEPDLKIPNSRIIVDVLDAAAGTRLEVPVNLAVLGLRRGEICALTLDDLDDSNLLHICKSMVEDDDGYLHIKPPKTRAGDRFIVIPSDLADLAREQGYFCNMTPKAFSDAFPHLLHKAGVPADQFFRLHDCRHFFVSYCHELGLTDQEIIELSGHRTDYIMKHFYRHAISDHRIEVAKAFGALRFQGSRALGN